MIDAEFLSRIFVTVSLIFLLAGIHDVENVSDGDQADRGSESVLVPEDSPVLLDESNVFDNIKPDFRNADTSSPAEIETTQQIPHTDGTTTTTADDSTVVHSSDVLNNTVENVLGLNSTLNETSSERNATEAKYKCVLKVAEEGELPKLQLMNSSSLVRALSPIPNVTVGECALVVFYSPWCIFSAKAAPNLNALPRLFPHFSIFALDVVTHSNLNMRYGLVAVPTLMLFYNGKAVARFNESELLLEKIVVFVQKYTGITHHGNLSINEEESVGPLSPVPAERRDYILILSWLIIIACSCGWFLQSHLCQKIVEGIRNTWREAEAQHEHVD